MTRKKQPWTSLTTRWGEGISNPTAAQLAQAVHEVFVEDDPRLLEGDYREHPSAWLSHGVDDGPLFVIDIGRGRNARFDQWEDVDYTRELAPSKQLEVEEEADAVWLWSLLASDDLDALRALDWKVGLTEQVEPILVELFMRNAATPSKLRGGAFCAEFVRIDDDAPWIQVKTGVLNIFWPFDDEPLARLSQRLHFLPPGLVCAECELGKFATLEFQPLKSLPMARVIEALFVLLYEFPPTTQVTAELIDQR